MPESRREENGLEQRMFDLFAVLRSQAVVVAEAVRERLARRLREAPPPARGGASVARLAGGFLVDLVNLGTSAVRAGGASPHGGKEDDDEQG